MHVRLNNYITKFDILFTSQHGFQSGHSTFMPLLSMQDKISAAMDKNEFSIGVFLDLAKAFDTIDHGILLKKLSIYGIRNTQLNWFKSYLDNRMQLVSCNGIKSPLKLIEYGVPQGSILGPLLFILYINDLPNVSSDLFFILFADDTNIFNSHSSIETLINHTNSELCKVADWFQLNKLTLNLDKTNFILFRAYKKSLPISYSNLCIMGTPITQVQSSRFLGVYVDQHLSWKDHISNISTKIAKNLGILMRISRIFPPQTRTALYYTLIHPYISYCNIVWASAYKSNLSKLLILQKRAIRFVAKLPYGAHTKPEFLSLKILKPDQIRQVQIGIFMYRYTHNKLPTTYRDYFQPNSIIRNRCSRNTNPFYTPFARTNTKLTSIKCAGPRTWNSIPHNIRSLPSLRLFKRELSTYIQLQV